MDTKKILYVFLTFLVLAGPKAKAVANPNDVYAALREHLDQTRNGVVVSTFVYPRQLKKADPEKVLSILSEYENDTHLGVRHRVYYYQKLLAQLHPQPEIRCEVVKRLVKAMIDPTDNSMLHPTSGHLLSFRSKDFSVETKEMLRSALLRKDIHYRLILVCGVADIPEELERFKGLLIDELKYHAMTDKTGEEKWYFTIGWAARLARARMGVEEDIKKCINLVEDELEHGGYFEGRGNTPVTKLLSDIGYISQPEAVRYLQQQLESKKRLRPSNPGMLGEPVANYVMSILADRLIDFPVKPKKARNYTQQDFEVSKKWMAKQKVWKVVK